MDLSSLIAQQRAFFNAHGTASGDFRRQQLQKLSAGVKKSEAEIFAALKADLGKPELESLMSETASVLDECKIALKNLSRWMREQKVPTPLLAQPAKSFIRPEPKGVVLVMSPWNYPISLALNPVVGALAAGNTVILKPSELTPACSRVLKKIIDDNFAPEVVACVEGDAKIASDLLKQRFDHIFFTGSTQVGRLVMRAAAEHLTPVTLELGGKSPCIVDQDCALEVTVKRIVWGKYFNTGQTCVAPDYVLVHEGIRSRFVEKLKEEIKHEFGEDPSRSPDYGRIVNDRHFDRVSEYLRDGKIASGGEYKRESRYLAPTVLLDPALDSPVMQNEIFGPILPVLTFRDLGEVKKIISERPNPLALYVFTRNADFERKIISEIPAGGVCVNDTLMHVACPSLPFGGRGESGMGAYHGKASFDVFTHFKSVLRRSTLIDPPVRYRPYAKRFNLAKWFLGSE